MSDSGPILHVSVALCPHIVGFFRDDIPPEDHIVLTAECEVCGTVTATPPRPRPDRPGFVRYSLEDVAAISEPLIPGRDCFLGPRYGQAEDAALHPEFYECSCPGPTATDNNCPLHGDDDEW